MGLDMYAHTTTKKPETDVDFVRGENASEEFHYWRKHPDMHGWMQQLYRAKGGQDAEFNVSPLLLTLDDLERLERDVNNGALPHTNGFFFGESSDEDRADDLEFIAKARTAIAAGKFVFYYAWW